jgi:hypothetical protein
LAVPFLIFAAFVAPAEAYCSKPDAPYCATRSGRFDDQDDFDRCRRQMQYYQSEVESFLSCLRNDSDEVLREHNDAVSSFNRRTRG